MPYQSGWLSPRFLQPNCLKTNFKKEVLYATKDDKIQSSRCLCSSGLSELREATVHKVCSLIEEAADKGARLIAFPETLVQGYPHWYHFLRVDQGHPFHIRLVKNAVEVPSEATDQICRAAKKAHAIVVVGINERDPVNWGTLYNTNLIIDQNGDILGKHRKIMPTMVEKICWGAGDGSSLRVYDTILGLIGTLICGENGNPLAKFALLAQGKASMWQTTLPILRALITKSQRQLRSVHGLCVSRARSSR